MSVVIGYAMMNSGQYRNQYYFDESINKIALFILQNKDKEVVVTDIADCIICKARAGFIFECDQRIVSELAEELRQLEQGEKECLTIQFIEEEPGVMKDVEIKSRIF